jgi:hypothetical protein
MKKETVATYWPSVEILLEAQVSGSRAVKGAKVLASINSLNWERLHGLYVIYSATYK